MARFDRDGYAIADLVLSDSACERIIDEFPEISAGRGGVRDLIQSETVARVIQSPQLVRAIGEVADGPFVAVKATLFDKTAGSNWRVQWHQDRVIAVRERLDVDGYGPWSVKNGVVHVEPPANILERMLAVRVQLDDCGPDNGPLRVIPRSHEQGKLSSDEIARVVATSAQVQLAVPRGSILFMRPLLVHASSPAVRAEHRRVLHIELAPPDAIRPLQWHHAVPLSR